MAYEVWATYLNPRDLGMGFRVPAELGGMKILGSWGLLALLLL